MEGPMFIEALAAVAMTSGAGQEVAPRVAPRGDYRDSCSGEYVNRGRLYADCRDRRGNIRGTSIAEPLLGLRDPQRQRPAGLRPAPRDL